MNKITLRTVTSMDSKRRDKWCRTSFTLMNAYEHNGKPRFSAIWRAGVSGSFKARHGLSSSEYQDEWESALKSGLLTRAVTGYMDGNAVRHAAVWRK